MRPFPCFNPRPRAGDDPGPGWICPCCLSFNPRPRAGDDILATLLEESLMVSIHAPVRGTTTLAMSGAEPHSFQSTPPCGGRRSKRHPMQRPRQFQSTPPCGGRPDYRHLNHNKHVSIHAPVRGTTLLPRFRGSLGKVSIHAPVRGTTGWNPIYIDLRGVSIHAPVRGTTCFDVAPLAVGVFQSTPPCGGRHRLQINHEHTDCFNPRPRAGDDRRNF